MAALMPNNTREMVTNDLLHHHGRGTFRFHGFDGAGNYRVAFDGDAAYTLTPQEAWFLAAGLNATAGEL